MQSSFSRGLSAPLVFLYPLEPDAHLERTPQNLARIGQQMLQTRVHHLVLGLTRQSIEILEVSFYPPTVLWLEGCVPMLLEPFELSAWLTATDAQVELCCRYGVLEVRLLEA